ncbi:hypothetical protein WICMUC_003737 [Wickerhamomyces mucosus]|uniref:V-type proton ATPase subunit G n=1 Tax=Wickerhamomyces mucosus TaxID=1378264 RepID=A0A9P8TBD2_9ASCO|nr:hypothetical protein WICMUC_003737 [Wickerhamomyces mucosus]
MVIEKEAHKIVAEARQYRTDRLKQAKVDANAEVEAYKQKKLAELKEFESQVRLNEAADKEAQEQVQTELHEIKELAAKKKDEVVKLLVNAVIKPTPELHVNAA